MSSQKQYVNISLSIKCQPSTTTHSRPIYRIYIDNDLITERTFIWDEKVHYICERMTAALDSGSHRIKIVPNMKPSPFSVFDVKVNDQPSALEFRIE